MDVNQLASAVDVADLKVSAFLRNPCQLAGIENALNFVGVGCLGKRQREQQARFPRLQIVARKPVMSTGSMHSDCD